MFLLANLHLLPVVGIALESNISASGMKNYDDLYIMIKSRNSELGVKLR
jgi:hypothetical protein